MSAIADNVGTNDAAATRRAQLRETINDMAAAVAVGVLANHVDTHSGDGAAGGTSSSQPTRSHVLASSYVPSTVRLQVLADSTRRLKQTLAEYEVAELHGSFAALQQRLVAVPGSATAAPLLALRAWNSQKKFADLCDLTLKPSSSTASSSPSATAAKDAFLAFGLTKPLPSSAATPSQDAPALRQAALKPIAQLETAFKELAKCSGFAYQDLLRERTLQQQQQQQHQQQQQPQGEGANTGRVGGAAPVSSSAHATKHMAVLVDRMVETLAELRQGWMSPAGASPPAVRGTAAQGTQVTNPTATAAARNAMPSLVSADRVKKVFNGIAAWPQPLLRLMNECLQAPTLEAITDASRERLRRAAFDVEELAHEQEQAVTDGDMHRSEDLYFEQSDLLESMKPLFDQLEGIMENFRSEKVEKPREQLRAMQKQFTGLYQDALRQEEKELRTAQEDLEKLQAQNEKLRQLRSQQQAGIALYNGEWGRLFDGNVKQQEECLSAMEQLEGRLRELAQEQAFLVTDRVEKLQVERQRKEAAAAFQCFADAHSAALANTARELRVLVDGLKQVGAAVEFSCGHFEAYLRDVLLQHVDDELLATRKQRLEQFRSLYLTLGDLQFKKARHADEIAKKVEYYHLQQEIAMDALNPKAKEFSQARQKWEMVQQEVNAQLHRIEARTNQQIEDFRPTEGLLIKAGVQFVHPAQELQQRNERRQQKLLEYKELMDSRVSNGVGASAAPLAIGGGGGPGNSLNAADGRVATDILAEDMRMFARNAPRLRSTEEGNYAHADERANNSALLGSSGRGTRSTRGRGK